MHNFTGDGAMKKVFVIILWATQRIGMRIR